MNLFDMEATWFEFEAVKCYIRGKKYGCVLKYYYVVFMYFD